MNLKFLARTEISLLTANTGAKEWKIQIIQGLITKSFPLFSLQFKRRTGGFWPEDADALKMIGVCVLKRVCVCVCNCVSRSSCMYSPQPGQTPASFSCPPCMDGYHTTVHQTFSFTYTSCHCSLSLSPSLCNYKVAEAVSPVSQRLAAWHWEWQRKRSPLSRRCTSPHSFAWRPDGGVVGDGGCAPVSAPALYPFLSITVQVKQMIGFSQRCD